MTEFDGLLSSPDVRTGYITRATFTNKKVTYSVVNGLAMFEGCICLGRVEDLEHQKVLIEAGLAPEIERGIARTGQQYRWPNALMPYEIDAALPNKNRVTDAIAHWTANTNMRFVLRTSSNASQYPNYVYFTKAGGCWSQVGMEGGKQTISLDDGCSTGNAIHEIGHAWGLWHEQSREDRNSFVKVNLANIEAGKEHNFNQQIADGDDIGGYDYGSIMHYGKFAFSKNNLPTIEPLTAGATIGQRTALSVGDISAVHAIYTTWHYNKRVFQAFASNDSQNAWANIEGLGWRKITPKATDGVTNIFISCCEAVANNKLVHAYADGANVSILYMA